MARRGLLLMDHTADGSDAARERTYWDRHARHYDVSMRLLGKPYPRMLALTAEAVRGAEVLEVAAGTGLVTLAIARTARHVVATDYAPEMVTLLGRRLAEAGVSNVECSVADLFNLPTGARYEAVVAANVLHLVPDLRAAIQSLIGVLRPGGKLVVPTFCHAETITSRVLSRVLALTGFPGRRRFTATALANELDNHAVRVLRTETIPGPIPICFVEGRV